MPENNEPEFQTRTFPKDFLVDELGLPDDADTERVKVLRNEIIDTSRWSVHYTLVFEFEGGIYGTTYSLGATEMQEEHPWDYMSDVKCDVMEAYQVEITEYRRALAR
jgi:hypothetical protein